MWFLGPFKLNRVPLRRVNQSYVIATQTKVDISKVTIPAEINDEYFKRITIAEKRKKGKTADIFQDSEKVWVWCDWFPLLPFSLPLQKYTVSDQRKTDQKKVDDQVLPCLRAVPQLRCYMGRKFFLSNGQYPHRMVF